MGSFRGLWLPGRKLAKGSLTLAWRVGFRPTALAVAGLCALATPSARADFFLHTWDDFHAEEGTPHLIPAFRYYTTASNFDASGTAVAPGALSRYTRIQLDAAFVYPFSPRITAFARASWQSASLSLSGRSASSFGMADQTIGLNYRVFPNPEKEPGAQLSERSKPPAISLDLQAQMDFPAYSTASSATSGQAALGDGSLDTTLGGFLSVPFGRAWGGHFRGLAGLGFTYRTNGYSAAIPWSGWALFEPREQGWLAGIGMSGIISMNSNQSANLAGTSTAGSFVTGSVNPSLLQVSGRVGYRFASDITASATGTNDLWGKYSPRAFQGYAAIDIPFGSSGKKEPPPKEPALVLPKKYGASNQGFVSYSLEAHVQRISDRINQLRIDKGEQQGVAVGQAFDIFAVKPDGTVGESVARCKVTSVKADESNLTIVEYFREVWIEEGFLARRLVQ